VELLWNVTKDGGPWAAILLLVAAFVYALARGILMRGAEVERIERRMEKDTDRVLELYKQQIATLVSASAKKDETIASQDAQIARLIDANDTATQALDKIVKEAEKRGFFLAT
jgi:hypothetical protein